MSEPVGLSVSSTLVDPDDARAMSLMYLPDDDVGNRWAIDKVTWFPSDASLAALPFPVVPDTDAVDPAPVTVAGGPTAYYGHVVLEDVPEEINPGGDGQGYIAGTLAGAAVRIVGGRLSIELAIARRIPAPGIAGLDVFVTAADIAADFPGVTPLDVDPSISAYDARLAHP